MLKSDAPHPRTTWKNLLNFSDKSPAAQLLNTNSGVQHYNKTEEWKRLSRTGTVLFATAQVSLLKKKLT